LDVDDGHTSRHFGLGFPPSSDARDISGESPHQRRNDLRATMLGCEIFRRGHVGPFHFLDGGDDRGRRSMLRRVGVERFRRSRVRGHSKMFGVTGCDNNASIARVCHSDHPNPLAGGVVEKRQLDHVVGVYGDKGAGRLRRNRLARATS